MTEIKFLLKNIIGKQEGYVQGKGWKRRVLLNRSCKTQNPFRCNDSSYKMITKKQRLEREENELLKEEYKGICIDKSQICDLTVDCINGEDEGAFYIKTQGNDLHFLNLKNLVFD